MLILHKWTFISDDDNDEAMENAEESDLDDVIQVETLTGGTARIASTSEVELWNLREHVCF